MKVAEYPQKKCREGISTEEGLGYNCELPLMHAGPCATTSNASSAQRRDRWEDENPGWEDRPNLGGDIIL